MQVFGIVLAAGSSRRFGTSKQLARYRGLPLAAHAVRLAEAVCGDRTLLLVGAGALEVAEACRPLQGFLAVNDDYREGIGSSIRSGVGAVAHAADGVLLLLADQPLVTRPHLEALLREWRLASAEIVASRYAGTHGPPAVFPARLFDALRALSGDRGARDILAMEQGRVRLVDCEDAAVDVDRPEDLAALDDRTPAG